MKGLHCSILVPADHGSCSNGGISSRVKTVTLVGDGIPTLFEPSPDAPAVFLVRRTFFEHGEYLHASPVAVDPSRGPLMFGGCFIYTSDSRFPSRQPIPLHDRQEDYRHEG